MKPELRKFIENCVRRDAIKLRAQVFEKDREQRKINLLSSNMETYK